ncbi:PspC domain-containing protein [Rubrolithibacter danxiaensis]|uniref:PspC domain-containing protein n=1 Tax=Rubrolithibacter danxiaensis TaxID=3390805 RepID=UPI003BF80BDE
MERRLQRDEIGKILGGVASGLADYLSVDVTIIRIAFILMAVFGGSGVFIYIILWIAIPARPLVGPYSKFEADYKVYGDQHIPGNAPFSNDFKPKNTRNGSFIAGIILVCLGVYFLFDEFNFIPYWFSIEKLWPIVFIIPGVLILSNSRKKQASQHYESTKTESNNEKVQEEKDLNSDQPLN